MGEETNWTPGYDTMKTPRGILNYALSGHAQTDISWKVTGNLGGEDYADQTRGPLNEGALYAERQGYHFPKPPSEAWEAKNPVTEGVDDTGVGFFATEFELDIPKGWDVPLDFVFANVSVASYRVQLFVNGYQFGKYSEFLISPFSGLLILVSGAFWNACLFANDSVPTYPVNNLGPQTSFPVPQGILNYSGTNYVAVTLWSQEESGAKLGGFQLAVDGVIQSGMRDPGLSPMPNWTKRVAAY